MTKSKSALDRLKEMPQKKLVVKLGCPSDYNLSGAYSVGNRCMVADKTNPTPGEDVNPEQCKACWAKKF